MARIPRPVVQAVEPGSLADKAGIQAGDKVTHINGQLVRDALDFQFLTAEEDLELTVLKSTGQCSAVKVAKELDDELGIDFGGKATFDGVYTCHNNCVFCFVHQQPKGMRPTLNLMDDDFRLSFMHGNFITLVGIEPENWQRVMDQKLSPMYVSVHASDDDLRAYLMGTEQARGIMNQLQELADAGIDFHTQMVCCPGLNDGAHIDKTISDLLRFAESGNLLSISVVPVGLTKYRAGLHALRPHTGAEAAVVVDQLERWQEHCLEHYGHRIAWASDEWYVMAGREVPPTEWYEDYGQFENGVGMIRSFLDEVTALEARYPESVAPKKVTLVTGMVASETVNRAARSLNGISGLDVQVVTVLNEFYGPTVTVAGLLIGQDMVRALQDLDLGDLVVLPGVAVRDGDARTLDNMTESQIAEALGGVAVTHADTPTQLAQIILGDALQPEKKAKGRRRIFRHVGEAAVVNMEKFQDPLKR